MLEALGLGCERGDRLLFSAIDFRLDDGEALQVAGANGSGKTSLLRLLAGLAHPAAGGIRWNGHDLHEVRDVYAKEMAYVGHAHALKDDLLACENLMVAAQLAGQPAAYADACRALDGFGAADLADLPVRVLSQGQRRRVALARLKVRAARLWILDEPFTALDLHAMETLRIMLSAHVMDGGILVYTTHGEAGIPDVCARRLDLQSGSAC